MPRATKESDKEPSSRYSSVTLPRKFCFFLDKLIVEAAKEEASTEFGNFIPSRRAIVQDAVELYIEQLFPKLHNEYVDMCIEANLYQQLQVHQRWNIQQKLLEAKAKESE